MLLWVAQGELKFQARKDACRQCCFALRITPFGGRKSFSRSSGRKEEAVECAGRPTEKTGQGQDTHAATRNLPPRWKLQGPLHLAMLYVLQLDFFSTRLTGAQHSHRCIALWQRVGGVGWQARGMGGPLEGTPRLVSSLGKGWEVAVSTLGGAGKGRRAGVVGECLPIGQDTCKSWKSVINLIRKAWTCPKQCTATLGSGRSTNGNNRLYLLRVPSQSWFQRAMASPTND